jgi:polysaccharide deacetylase 2 family uncharacterized protein YibQ
VVALGALLIALLGDPSAGAPSLRVALSAASEEGDGRIRRLLSPEDAFAEPTLDPLQFAELGGLGLGEAPAVGGQAVITLPSGGRTTNGVTVRNLAEGRRFAASPLPAAPLPGLVAASATGPLPVVAGDGRTPERAYARPFTSNGKPKVALVIGGLGLNAAQTRAAIENLPPEVTLSFVPYADGLQGWVDQARARGHEVMLEIPMEPLDYPTNDPGPYTLLAQARPEETTSGSSGCCRAPPAISASPTTWVASSSHPSPRCTPVPGALKARGSPSWTTARAAPRAGAARGVSRASADRIVDEQLSPDSIERQLLALEAAALQRGGALGAGFAYPVTVEQAARWAEGLPQRGYQLAPASAITRR